MAGDSRDREDQIEQYGQPSRDRKKNRPKDTDQRTYRERIGQRQTEKPE